MTQMTNDTATAPALSRRVPRPLPNPLTGAYSEMIGELLALRAPRIPVTPDPEHALLVSDHLREIAEAVDRYIAIVGEQLDASTPYTIDLSLFDRQLFGALDGNALFEIQRTAESIAEDNDQFGMGA